MSPLISVIMPTFNRAEYIREALDSIKRQTFKDYEVIIVDDGSTDNTKEIVKTYEGIRYIYQEHSGISKARNTAIKAVRGRWIATLDSDDLWKEEKLQKQVDYVLGHADCRIVYTLFSNFTDIPNQELGKRQQELLHMDINCYLPSALIDARLFSEIGMYDENLEYGEDTDWNIRLRFHKVDIGHCINEVLYLRRVHNSNISSTHKEINNSAFWRMTTDAFRKAYRNTRKAESTNQKMKEKKENM